MNWIDLVTAGHVLWHLRHRTVTDYLDEQGLRMNTANSAALRSGELVVSGQALGTAQPVMTLAPHAGQGQWWWASKAAGEDNRAVAEALRQAAQDVTVMQSPTVSFTVLTEDDEPTVGHAAEAVCAAATALLEGPDYTAIPVGNSLIVSAVQIEHLPASEITTAQVERCASELRWNPGDTEAEIAGALHLSGVQ